ncbi:MAG: SNF2-related protein [Myxococcota bacterium]
MNDLFEAVRAEAESAVWSRGVELVRRGAVSVEATSDDEVVLRVLVKTGRAAPAVRLHPRAASWECDCDGPDDPCEHTCAALIALRRARESGEPLQSAAVTAPKLGYRLARQPGGLALARVLVRDGRDEPLASSLSAYAAGRAAGPAPLVSAEDLAVERLIDSRRSTPPSAEAMQRLLAALVGCDDVRLEGAPVAVSLEPVLPIARVEDRGDGFAVQLARDPRLGELFANGVALCGGALRPLGDPHLGARDRAELTQGRVYPPEAAGRLVSEVIPELRARIPVEIHTTRLPREELAKPRLQALVTRHGDRLRVAAELVYGDPPVARVEDGRLVALGDAVPRRSESAEAALVSRLERELGLAPGMARELGPADAIEFRGALERFSGDVVGRAHQSFHLAPELEPELRGGSNRFELDFSAGKGGARADAARVLRAWAEGESLVSLGAGGFAPLPLSWLAKHGQRVADLLAARAADGSVPACALPDLARLCGDLGAPAPPGFERLRALVEGFDGLPEAALPGDLTAALRGYQRDGVRWLAFLRAAGLGGLLADDMGLGKTLQALCAVSGRTLVVAPTSVLFGWAEQAARFRPSLRISVYHGAKRALDPAADLTLTSYALLRLDSEILTAVDWDTLVLDEAQAIKNPDSQVARAAFALRGAFRLTLTGTPVENRLDELWSQFHFSNPGLLGSLADFRERYAKPIAAGEPGAAAHLRARIAPFLLRRLKREVARELPPRTEAVLHCELDPDERAVYDAVRAASQREVVARLQSGGSVLEALELLLRLRQAACHRALVPGQHAAGSTKLAVLLESLEEAVAEGHKALVFSQWTSFLDLIEPSLRGAELGFTRLDGSTVDRAGVVERFQSPDGPPVLLLSLRAGGVGLNLTAADHVFLLDPWWNPAVEEQAADRAHRIGQDRPVMVYRLVARDTVEERILALQQRKRELAQAALAGADRAGAITREDLLALLA